MQSDTARGAASTPTASPISAAFENFDKGSESTTSSPSIVSTDSQSRGVFQNVRITPDTADNSIVVYSNQEDYRIIERSLHQLDQPRLQVAIDATVAEVTLTDELQFGVQYFFANHSGNVGLTTAASAPVTADAASAVQSAVQSAFLSRVLPGFNLLLGSEAQPKVILSALSNLTTVKVLSAPSVVVMDNQPALLQVGNGIPIQLGPLLFSLMPTIRSSTRSRCVIPV